MNVLQVMDRYRKRSDASKKIKELYKGSVSLQYKIKFLTQRNYPDLHHLQGGYDIYLSLYLL